MMTDIRPIFSNNEELREWLLNVPRILENVTMNFRHT